MAKFTFSTIVDVQVVGQGENLAVYEMLATGVALRKIADALKVESRLFENGVPQGTILEPIDVSPMKKFRAEDIKRKELQEYSSRRSG